VVISFISREWKLNHISLGVWPFPGSHSAARTLNLLQTEILPRFSVGLASLLASTQDTTGSSFNTFEEVESVNQIGCFIHISMLVLKWTVNSASDTKHAFDTVRKLNVFLLESPQRINRLREAQTANNVKRPLNPYIPGDTRWCGNIIMLNLTLRYFESFKKYYDHPTIMTTSEKSEFSSMIAATDDALNYLRNFQKFFYNIELWTKLMQGRGYVTVSLVRTAIRSWVRETADLLGLADELLAAGTLIDKIHGTAMIEFGDRFLQYAEEYFLQKQQDQVDTVSYYDYWLFRIAEYLDPRVAYGVAGCIEEVKTDIIDNFLFEDEKKSGSSSMNADVNRVSLPKSMRPKTILTLSIFETEVEEYLTCLQNMSPEKRLNINPLEFWKNQPNLKIHRRVAQQILSIPASEAYTESNFSISRRVVPWHRSSLSPDKLNKIVSLNRWMAEEESDLKPAKDKKGVILEVHKDEQHKYVLKVVPVSKSNSASDLTNKNATTDTSNNNNKSSARQQDDDEDDEDDEDADEEDYKEELERNAAARIKSAEAEMQVQKLNEEAKNNEILRKIREEKESRERSGNRVSSRLPKLKNILDL
jgi:hypothetical protein